MALYLANRGPAYGWGWVMATLLVFSGTQLVMLGLIGEYLGRTFLTVNQRPQSAVREVVTNVDTTFAQDCVLRLGAGKGNSGMRLR